MCNTMNDTSGIDVTLCTAHSGRAKCGATSNLGLKPQAINPYSFAVSPGCFAALRHSFAAMFITDEVSTL